MPTMYLHYTKENADGTVSYISGGSASIRVIRAADWYDWDSVASAFVASGTGTDETMSDAGADGVFSHSFTTTAWDNGTYLVHAIAWETGEAPGELSETWVITNGVVSGTVSAGSAAAGYCRVYVYYPELPATEPTVTARYTYPAMTSTQAIALSTTGTYSSITGLHYFDLVRGATVEMSGVSRGLHKTFIVPALTEVAYPSLRNIQ